MLSAAVVSGADAAVFEPTLRGAAVVGEAGSAEVVLPVEQPVRTRAARALRLRTVVVGRRMRNP